MTNTTQRVLLAVLLFLAAVWVLSFLLHLAYGVILVGTLALIVFLAVGWWLERRKNRS